MATVGVKGLMCIAGAGLKFPWQARIEATL